MSDADRIFDEVKVVLRQAECFGGPEGEEYERLMRRVSDEASHRLFGFRLANICAQEPRCYRLTGVDGDNCYLTLAEFFEDNESMIGTGEDDDIFALGVGDEYVGGGGAGPLWRLKRIS